MKSILKYYPNKLHHYKRNILREYLQYLILKGIFTTKKSKKISFIGGTALHICHDLKRFSEDLDFDHSGLSKKEFKNMVGESVKKLEDYGFEVESKFTFTKAYRAHLKFKNILQKYNLTGHKEEKLLVMVDATKQDYKIKKETFLLNKFSIYQNIFVNPVEIITSQKLISLIKRKHVLGRDCYDISWLSGFVNPDEDYIKAKTSLTLKETKNKIRERLTKLDLNKLAEDVEPFLYEEDGIKRVKNFLKDLDSMF